MPPEYFNLPLEIQTALGGGYLAFAIAYAGLSDQYRATDIVFRTMAFGLISLMAFRLSQQLGPIGASALGVAAALVAGILWRVVGIRLVNRILAGLGVHREDGTYSAWTALIQQPGLTVSQLSVHTKDGRILYQNALHDPKAHLNGMYFGRDGSIVMVVEEEELPDGTEEVRTGVRGPEWNTRVTYIPADQITRVNLR